MSRRVQDRLRITFIEDYFDRINKMNRIYQTFLETAPKTFC